MRIAAIRLGTYHTNGPGSGAKGTRARDETWITNRVRNFNLPRLPLEFCTFATLDLQVFLRFAPCEDEKREDNGITWLSGLDSI